MQQRLRPQGLSIRQAATQLDFPVDALAREYGYSCQWWLDLEQAWDEKQKMVA